MTETGHLIAIANELFEQGYLREAESFYNHAIRRADLGINLFARDRKTLDLMQHKVEATRRLAEISLALGRRDDAEHFSRLVRSLRDYLTKHKGIS